MATDNPTNEPLPVEITLAIHQDARERAHRYGGTPREWVEHLTAEAKRERLELLDAVASAEESEDEPIEFVPGYRVRVTGHDKWLRAIGWDRTYYWTTDPSEARIYRLVSVADLIAGVYGSAVFVETIDCSYGRNNELHSLESGHASATHQGNKAANAGGAA